MSAVGALLATGADQALVHQHRQHRGQDLFLQAMRDQPGAELAQHAGVEPRIGQLQTHGVFPVDGPRHHLRGLPVGQVLHVLQRGYQRQRPRRLRRRAPDTERRRELLVGEYLTQLVPGRHRHTALRERRPSHQHRLLRNPHPRPRLHRHPYTPSRGHRGEEHDRKQGSSPQNQPVRMIPTACHEFGSRITHGAKRAAVMPTAA